MGQPSTEHPSLENRQRPRQDSRPSGTAEDPALAPIWNALQAFGGSCWSRVGAEAWDKRLGGVGEAVSVHCCGASRDARERPSWRSWPKIDGASCIHPNGACSSIKAEEQAAASAHVHGLDITMATKMRRLAKCAEWPGKQISPWTHHGHMAAVGGAVAGQTLAGLTRLARRAPQKAAGGHATARRETANADSCRFVSPANWRQ
ncbi:hypothetical protein CDD81_4418 [Ophiocordyceps australis]|uniref:Uncharacterized protein n=1 Tax=Ophiocordyceps australis TaxID=1399860 RepID=A0A2C5YHC8_9HYPO|nr:hypothetical protein CDD81_4418 [Ophiocordyceps australis]